jgi:hypothetical protein
LDILRFLRGWTASSSNWGNGVTTSGVGYAKLSLAFPGACYVRLSSFNGGGNNVANVYSMVVGRGTSPPIFRMTDYNQDGMNITTARATALFVIRNSVGKQIHKKQAERGKRISNDHKRSLHRRLPTLM